jgi:hypothetical protein
MNDYFEYAEQEIAVVDSEGNTSGQSVYVDSDGHYVADTWAVDSRGNYVEEIDVLVR